LSNLNGFKSNVVCLGKHQVIKQEISWSEIYHRILGTHFIPGHKFAVTVFKYMVCQYSQGGPLQMLLPENHAILSIFLSFYSALVRNQLSVSCLDL